MAWRSCSRASSARSRLPLSAISRPPTKRALAGSEARRLRRLQAQVLAGDIDRGAGTGRAKGAAGAGPGRIVAVAQQHLDPLHRQAERLAGDLPQDGVGPGADIGHRGLHCGRAIGLQADPGLGRPEHVGATGRGHAHADQPVAVAHLTGLGIAFGPAEAAGAVLHAFHQLAGGEGDVLFRVLAGFVADAQLDGIEREHDRELVHGAFAGKHPHASPGARQEPDSGRSSSTMRCATRRSSPA